MEEDIIKKADDIIDRIVESSSGHEKIAMVLRVMPTECFDEAFRYFSREDQKKILQALEEKSSSEVNTVESMIVVREFITRNNLDRYLKTTTLSTEEALQAFQRYAAKHPRQISKFLSETWLEQ